MSSTFVKLSTVKFVQMKCLLAFLTACFYVFAVKVGVKVYENDPG